MKKIALILLALLPVPVAFAFSPVRQVQISTGPISQQTGGFNTSTGTTGNFVASTITVNNQLTLSATSTNTFAGSITDASTTTHSGAQTFSSMTVTGNFNAAAATFTATVSMSNQKIINVASGTVASDAVRYSQNKLLNEIKYTVTTTSQTTSATFVPSNLLGTITPSNTASTIEIMACFTGTTSGLVNSVNFTIERGPVGSAVNLGSSTGLVQMGSASIATGSLIFPVCMITTDAPATTSSTTYTVYMDAGGAQTVGVGTGTNTQTLILKEINGL